MDVAALVDDLRSLGVREGDVLMVHASLRALGPVDGGAGGVVDALDHAVGDSGTLLMTLGSDGRRPTVERLLRGGFATRTAGRARTGTVGNARSEFVDAADFVEFASDWMGRHLS